MAVSLGRNTQQAYLRLQVTPQCESVVDMKYAEEAVVIPASRVTMIPNTKPAMIGILNHRNRVFWLIDLPHLLGFPMLSSSVSEYSVALLRLEDNPLALAVHHIKGVMRADQESLRSPLELEAPDLVPYLQGCLREGEKTILVLDALAISRSVE